MEKEDAAAAMDNMHNGELYGRVLTVNIAQPMKIKGGEQGWASQPVWADADTWFERQQQEEEIQRMNKEQKAAAAAAANAPKGAAAAADRSMEEEEEGDAGPGAVDPMAAAEAEALNKP
ncbi:hypothetical protein CLOM_g17876 [Closterium sp. NIES-68]|nr:hypothetical protein CLOM_g17876 [Closterium sp. NIES-68]GJP74013.1 hypothetical protein CLOP_g4665 [Closterium sp. NIES-67]